MQLCVCLQVPFAQDFLQGVMARESVVDTFNQYVEGSNSQPSLQEAAQDIAPRPSNVLCTGQVRTGVFGVATKL